MQNMTRFNLQQRWQQDDITIIFFLLITLIHEVSIWKYHAECSSHKQIHVPQLTAPHNKRIMKVVFHALVKLGDVDAKTEPFLLFFFPLKW